MTGLDVRDLTVRFGAQAAVDHVDLAVPAGSVVAVLGPSGCGKSTLLRAVAGLEVPASGSVSYDGHDLAGTPTHRRGFALAVSLGEFGATSFLAREDRPTLPVVIYRLVSHPGAANFGMAMAASVVLAGATTLVMLAVQRLRVGSVGSL